MNQNRVVKGDVFTYLSLRGVPFFGDDVAIPETGMELCLPRMSAGIAFPKHRDRLYLAMTKFDIHGYLWVSQNNF